MSCWQKGKITWRLVAQSKDYLWLLSLRAMESHWRYSSIWKTEKIEASTGLTAPSLLWGILKRCLSDIRRPIQRPVHNPGKKHKQLDQEGWWWCGNKNCRDVSKQNPQAFKTCGYWRRGKGNEWQSLRCWPGHWGGEERRCCMRTWFIKENITKSHWKLHRGLSSGLTA